MFDNPSIARVTLLAALLLAGYGFFGCGRSDAPPRSAPAVTVSRVLEQDVIEWDEYPGRLESPQIANLAARVSGIIVQAQFDEGALVNEGDLLFVIDDRPFKADYASKAAEVGRAEALLAQAEALFKRYQTLDGTRAISEQEYDEAEASLQQARANVNVAKAAAEISKLNLEWTKVRAPISGRISRRYVTEGNLVNGGNGQPTRLTTITSVDPMYCNISIPERDLMRYRALIDGDPSHLPLSCSIQLENETDFGHDCTVNFIDNQVDPSTGTVALRGVVPNPGGELTSGLFARMRIVGSKPYKALLVPDSALATDQSGRIVYVINASNVAESRPVKLGTLFGKLRSIVEGVKAGERIVVSGIQLVRPGTPVNALEAPPANIAAVPAVSLPVPSTQPEQRR